MSVELESIKKLNTLANLKKWAALEKMALQILDKNPDSYFPKFYLAYANHATNKWKKAREIVDILLPLHPEKRELLQLHASILITEKKYDSADEVLEKLLTENPEDDTILGMAAKVKLSKLKFSESEYFAKSALGINPQNKDAAEVLAFREMIEPSEIDTAKLLSDNVNNEMLLVNKMNSLLDEGKVLEAYDLGVGLLAKFPMSEYTKDAVCDTLLYKQKWYSILSKIAKKIKIYSVESIYRVLGFLLVLLFILLSGYFLFDKIYPNKYHFNIAAYSSLTLLCLPIWNKVIGNLYLLFHKIGKTLTTKKIKVASWICMTLVLLSINIIIFSLIHTDSKLIPLAFYILSITVPVSYIADTDENHSFLLNCTLALNLLFGIFCFFIAGEFYLLISAFINLSFLIFYAFYAGLIIIYESNKEKYAQLIKPENKVIPSQVINGIEPYNSILITDEGIYFSFKKYTEIDTLKARHGNDVYFIPLDKIIKIAKSKGILYKVTIYFNYGKFKVPGFITLNAIDNKMANDLLQLSLSYTNFKLIGSKSSIGTSLVFTTILLSFMTIIIYYKVGFSDFGLEDIYKMKPMLLLLFGLNVFYYFIFKWDVYSRVD